jgi:hypothetical protein
MSRKWLTDAEISKFLASINHEESEGDYFSEAASEEKFIPNNIISAESSGDEEGLVDPGDSLNPSLPRSDFIFCRHNIASVYYFVCMCIAIHYCKEFFCF